MKNLLIKEYEVNSGISGMFSKNDIVIGRDEIHLLYSAKNKRYVAFDHKNDNLNTTNIMKNKLTKGYVFKGSNIKISENDTYKNDNTSDTIEYDYEVRYKISDAERILDLYNDYENSDELVKKLIRDYQKQIYMESLVASKFDYDEFKQMKIQNPFERYSSRLNDSLNENGFELIELIYTVKGSQLFNYAEQLQQELNKNDAEKVLKGQLDEIKQETDKRQKEIEDSKKKSAIKSEVDLAQYRMELIEKYLDTPELAAIDPATAKILREAKMQNEFDKLSIVEKKLELVNSMDISDDAKDVLVHTMMSGENKSNQMNITGGNKVQIESNSSNDNKDKKYDEFE